MNTNTTQLNTTQLNSTQLNSTQHNWPYLSICSLRKFLASLFVILFLFLFLFIFFKLNIFEILVIWIIAGLNSATWWAYKDSIVEGFNIISFMRSLIVWWLVSILLYLFFDINWWILFLSVIGVERLFTELYKMGWRVENQEKYAIPMYFSYLGNVIYDTKSRRFVLGFILLFLFLVSYILYQINLTFNFFQYILWALVVWLLVMLGWANKDAPFEGFDFLKVWRSIFIALIGGIVIFIIVSYATTKIDSVLVYMLMIAWFERMFSEFYKSFLKWSIPGKFKLRKVIFRDNLICRWILLIWNIFTLLVLLVLVFLDILQNFKWSAPL